VAQGALQSSFEAILGSGFEGKELGGDIEAESDVLTDMKDGDETYTAQRSTVVSVCRANLAREGRKSSSIGPESRQLRDYKM
jgi:hypothetical protein